MTEREMLAIRSLSEANAPSGFEDETVRAARDAIGNACSVTEDFLRNLYLYRRRNTGDKPVLMLDAHSDEVGFLVHSIRPNGTIRVVPLGGWNRATLPGARVRVKNRDGLWIPGVIAAKPPHFMSAAEKERAGAPEIRDLSIDVGARSAEETESAFGIRIGEPVVPDTPFRFDEAHRLMHGKAFDCRLGCAALIEVMRRIADEDLAVDVVGVLSAQEEVGERGCRVSTHRVRPDAAIVFEGCPADDTFGEEYAMQTRLGNGPMIRFMDVSVISNPRFVRYALDLAKREGIPAQAAVREGGGNDAAVIQSTLCGAPAIVFGVPVRYIHTPACIASADDYEATVELALNLIRSLNESVIHSF
ncbi:MAG: M20/M25/M40 family metallo-hydrolase [Clostridia bacterium]|nr:M20/M25/M40 family metallo-hydrolase [Clostridia bacterium]